MKKRLFSGTSLSNYESLLERKDSETCLTEFTEDISIALGFALKRARQDHSICVIIEIIKLNEFKIVRSVSGHYNVIGLLNKNNHKVYLREKLNKSGKLIFKVDKTLKEIYKGQPEILSLFGLD
ncbi:MAG: hypothetical protein AABW56_04330 [Nanoarchaeota archaeon]